MLATREIHRTYRAVEIKERTDNDYASNRAVVGESEYERIALETMIGIHRAVRTLCPALQWVCARLGFGHLYPYEPRVVDREFADVTLHIGESVVIRRVPGQGPIRIKRINRK